MVYIETIPNRTSPPAILLREGYRENGKVVKRTLANLSQWDPQLVEHFRVLLKGGVAVESAASVLTIERALPHGHVAAVLGAARGSGSALWFGSAPKELQPVLQAMLVARVLEPASKLATHRMLHEDTATTSLGRVLGLGQCSADDLYRALDWLHDAQPTIERRLARQHLVGSTLVLYDLTSTWLTGRCCELAARGHSRDGKRDDPQIVFGLVCTAQGCPISVEVFKGNTADPATVAAQVFKLKERFGIERIAWAGDRGMLTSARIEQVLKPQGMDWVSSLRAPQIALLAAEHGPFQPSLFDERNLIELSSQHFPGERLVVCRNPLLAEERARKRLELLAATEADLAKIVAATQRVRNPLRGEQAIALRVGRVIERFHMAKHIELTITDTAFSWCRRDEAIAAEAALDGLYVILSGHRRQQVWDAAALRSPPTLLGDATFDEELLELPAAPEGEEVVFDYAATGLTLRRHPLALLRPQLSTRNLMTAADLQELPNGRIVHYCGLVTLRQQPETANGVIFVSLEDETGVVQVICWKSIREKQRKELLNSRLLEVHGTWQREGEMRSLIAGRLKDLTPLLGRLSTMSRDFK